MSEHLSLERISALVDEPAADAVGRKHLDDCGACQAEYERLSRMRMALSAMGEASPPPGEWEGIVRWLDPMAVGPQAGAGAGIEAGAGDEPEGDAAGARGLFMSRAFMGWPLRAAAAFLLFAGGILAGFQITGLGPDDQRPVVPWGAAGGSDTPDTPGPAGDDGALASLNGLAESESAYLSAMEALRELGTPRWVGGTEAADATAEPAVAAERLARLDALIRASRQAVEEVPADPVVNDLLFQLVDERNALASRFRESLHLTTLEYR